MLSLDTYWNDKMKIGISHLDEHHKTLVRLMLEAHESLISGAEREIIKGILAALISYSKYHFLAEERFMLENSYPKLEEQRSQHRYFVERIDELILVVAKGCGNNAEELFDFLKRWYFEHILKNDMLMGSWIIEQRE